MNKIVVVDRMSVSTNMVPVKKGTRKTPVNT